MNIDNLIKTKKYDVKKLDNQDGYVYFICNETGVVIYVGTTMNLYQRVLTLQSHVNFHKKPIYYIRVPKEDCVAVEAMFIKRMCPKHNTQNVPDFYLLQRKERERRAKQTKVLKGKIKKALKKHKLSQADLGTKLGVSRQYIHEVLHNKGVFRAATIQKITTGLREL